MEHAPAISRARAEPRAGRGRRRRRRRRQEEEEEYSRKELSYRRKVTSFQKSSSTYVRVHKYVQCCTDTTAAVLRWDNNIHMHRDTDCTVRIYEQCSGMDNACSESLPRPS